MSIGCRFNFDIFQNIFLTRVKHFSGMFQNVIRVYPIETFIIDFVKFDKIYTEQIKQPYMKKTGPRVFPPVPRVMVRYI